MSDIANNTNKWDTQKTGECPVWDWGVSCLGLGSVLSGTGECPVWDWGVSRLGLGSVPSGTGKCPVWDWGVSRLGFHVVKHTASFIFPNVEHVFLGCCQKTTVLVY